MMKMLYGMGIENYNAALENPGRLLFCVCPAKLDYTCRCKSGRGNRQ